MGTDSPSDVHVDMHRAMRVFERIRTEGVRDGDDYVLDGISANSGFDGYTVTLSGHGATLTVHFHNKYDLDYEQRSQLEDFLRKLERLDR